MQSLIEVSSFCQMHLIWFWRQRNPYNSACVDVHESIRILSNAMCFHQASNIKIQVTPSQSLVVCLSHGNKGVTETTKSL